MTENRKTKYRSQWFSDHIQTTYCSRQSKRNFSGIWLEEARIKAVKVRWFLKHIQEHILDDRFLIFSTAITTSNHFINLDISNWQHFAIQHHKLSLSLRPKAPVFLKNELWCELLVPIICRPHVGIYFPSSWKSTYPHLATGTHHLHWWKQTIWSLAKIEPNPWNQRHVTNQANRLME